MSDEATTRGPDATPDATAAPTVPAPPPPRAAKRVLGLTAALAAVVGLAFLVARPRADTETVAVNLAGSKEHRPPGLKVFLQRGPELAVLDPATELRRGDALRFVVRASAPRYLVVRARDGAGRERVLFPGRGAETAALVRPDQALPDALAIDETPGKETVTALFGQRPFSVTERPTREDIEVVTIGLVKAP
jgi:hypothetical protein